MWPNLRETADLVTFTEEIRNGKLHFLCSANKTIIRTLNIWKMLYTGCPMKEAISLLLSWNIYYFNNKWLLHMRCELIVTNQNKKTKTRTLYLHKMFYLWYSTKEAITFLPSWSTKNLDKWLLHMHFGLVVANQNQKTKIKTLNNVKTLYAGCTMKEAIPLLLSRSI